MIEADHFHPAAHILQGEDEPDKIPVTGEELASLWPDAEQRERALAGLLADGLAVAIDDGYELPRD